MSWTLTRPNLSLIWEIQVKVSETTDFIDSQVFIEYALSLKNLRPVSEQRVQGW